MAKPQQHSARTAEILRICARKSLRLTGQRRIVAQVIGEALDHPDVEELHRRAAKVDSRVSLSTVYRTVKLFEDSGIIERHDFGHGRSRYESAAVKHHDHLINVKTGAVVEFQSDEIERLQAEIARQHGFRLISHRLELYVVPVGEDE